jgi:HSP20 family protein
MKSTDSKKTMKSNTMTQTERRPVQQQAQQHEQRGYVSPRVNITETKDGYLLEAEMPGVGKDGLEIALENNELTILGRRGEEVQGLDLLYRESTNRDYRRVFMLDPTIDSTKIEAKMDNGVLRLHLPKAERVKPRRITVTD